MSKSLIVQNRSVGWVDNTTRYIAIAGVGVSTITVLGDHDIGIRLAGSFSNLFTYSPTNTASVNSTITLQKSQADSALTVTYGSDQTGIKEDTSNSVSFANTDEAEWKISIPSEPGSNTLTITLIGVQFTPDDSSKCVGFFTASGNNNVDWASATRYYTNGSTVSDTSETNEKYRCRFAFTSSNLFVYISSNARTTDTIIKTRKNAANGAQSVTYTNGQTGVKEDTTNSDTLAVGDDFCYGILTSTGTEIALLKIISSMLVSTANIFPLVAGYSGGTAVGPTVTTYFGIAGGIITTSTTEANYQIYPRFDFTASELGSYVSANTNAVLDCVVTLRDNGAGSGISVTYTAGQTGLKNDSVNTTVISSGTDEIDYEVANSDVTGSVTFTWLSCLGATSTANTETGSTTTPSVLAGTDQNIFTDTGSVKTPTVLTGADQDTFTDSGNVISPATLTGDGLWIFNKAGNVTTPAALTGSDADVFNKAGSTTTPVVLSGTEHPSDYNKTGNASTPVVLTGSDADIFTKTSGIFSPSTLTGSDANIFNDTGSTTTPAVLTGISSANQVYDKTGSVIAACSLTGVDANVFNDFGSAITPSAMSGIDSSIFNDNTTATAPVVLAGADQNDFTKTASVLSPATLTGSDADIFNKVGSTTAPVVLTGTDADVFIKTSGVFSPSTLTGTDANIFDDAGSVTTPVVLTGTSAIAKVYDKTGNVTTACVLSGTDSNIFDDTVSITIPVIISGTDQFISTDTAAVISPVMLSGAVPGVEVIQLPGGGRGWVVEIDAQGRQIIRQPQPQDDELEIFMSLN